MKQSVHADVEMIRNTERLTICIVGYYHPNCSPDEAYSYDIDQFYCNDERVPLEVFNAFSMPLTEDDAIHNACLVAVREAFQKKKTRLVTDVMDIIKRA